MVDFSSATVTTSANGQVTFSGLSSGINSQELISASVAAKRAPAVQLETRIDTNLTKIEAFNSLKTLAETFQASLDRLRGSTSFFSDDVFDDKLAFSTSIAGPSADPGFTPTTAGSLIGITLGDGADDGAHEITIQQLAESHQLRSDTLSSDTDALVNDLGKTAGSFTINGKSISLSSTDSLVNLKSKINTADAGVTASIISASDTSHFLVITSDDSGEDNEIVFGGDGTVLDDLGVTTTSGTVIKNELQTAENAIIDVDGITGIERASNEIDDVLEGVTLSLFQAEADTVIQVDIEPDLNTIKTEIASFVEAYNGIKNFITDQRSEIDTTDDDVDNPEFGPLAFDATLRQIESRITQAVTTNIAGLPDGFQSLAQLGVEVASDFTLEIDDATLDNKLLTNVDAVRNVFAFDFSTSDPRVQFVSNTDATSNAGTPGANIFDTELNDVDDLSGDDFDDPFGLVVSGVTAPDGSDTAFTYSVTSGGATNGSLRSTNTFALDPDTEYTFSYYVKGPVTDTNISALVKNVTDNTFPANVEIAPFLDSEYQRVAVTFTTDSEATDEYEFRPVSGVAEGESITVWGLKLEEGDTATTYESGPEIFYYNVAGTDADGNVLSANIENAINLTAGVGGADDGSATVSGATIIGADDTTPEGLKVLYNGGASDAGADDIRVSFTRGVADSLFNFFNDLTKLGGTLDDIETELLNQNTDLTDRIATIDARVDTFQANLEAKFLAMETALAELENLRNTIASFFSTDEDN